MNGLLANIWVPSVGDLRLFSPELALVATLVAMLIVPLITGRSNQVSAMIALIGSLATVLLSAALLHGPVESAALGGMSPAGMTPMLVVDKFAVFFKIFLMIFLALVTWLWLIGPERASAGPGRDPAGELTAAEFFVLLITSALGMSLMVSTTNLLVMVIAIETASLPSYAIVASDKRSRLGAEASLKYVLFGAATAAIMVYGVSLLYGLFGTLDIPTIAASIGSGGVSVLAMLAFFAVLVGIAFKISAAPFHFWCPDVFEGAPIEVTTWLSVASKAAGLGLLLRVVSIFSVSPQIAMPMMPAAYAIGFLAALTCTVGNLAALRQESVKRLLAYSSIAHAGYMMMAAAIFLPAGGSVSGALAAVVAYLLVYLLMNLGAFGVTAMVAWQSGTDHLSAFTALGRRAPWLAVPMTCCLVSLVGLPPFGGFTGKWYLLLALGQAASRTEALAWLWILVVVAGINTALSLFFYARIFRQMFLVNDDKLPPVTAPFSGLVMVNTCAALLLLLGTVLIGPLGEKSRTYASHLYTSNAVPPAVARNESPDATAAASFPRQP